MRVFAIILIILSFSVPGWGMRPLSTDDAATLGQGSWEIEEGYEFDQPRNGEESFSSFGTSIKYGIFSNIDLGVEIPYSVSTPGGMGDATIKGKAGLNDAFALGIDVKLANADSSEGLGSGYVDYGINGIFSQNIGNASIHANLGYTIVGQESGSNSENNLLSYSFSFLYPFNDAINLMSEICGSSTSSASDNTLEALIGMNLGVNDILTLDGGAAFGLTDADSEFKAILGATLAL